MELSLDLKILEEQVFACFLHSVADLLTRLYR